MTIIDYCLRLIILRWYTLQCHFCLIIYLSNECTNSLHVNIWTIYIPLHYFKLISHLNSDPSLPFKFHKIHCGSHIVFATHLITSGKQGQGSGKSVTIHQSTLNTLDERIHHCRQRTFWIPRKGILTSWTLRKESNSQPSNTKGHPAISCSPYFDKHFE